MKYDQTFARFARRMIKYTTVAIIGFAFISEFIWDWHVAVGIVLGGLFQILFLSFSFG